MKKSVALVIALVTLVSVAIVAFFGVRASNIEERVYIQTIEILDMEGHEIELNPVLNRKVLSLNFTPDLTDDDGIQYMQYFFNTRLNEGLAEPTTQDVLFSVASNEFVTISSQEAARRGAFLIKEKTTSNFHVVTITCQANDGGTAAPDSITLSINYNNNL